MSCFGVGEERRGERVSDKTEDQGFDVHVCVAFLGHTVFSGMHRISDTDGGFQCCSV